MHGHQARPHCGSRTNTAGDGVRNVVQLQIEEDVGAAIANAPNHVRPDAREQLVADLVESARIAQLGDKRECFVTRGYVERDDRNDAFALRHEAHCSAPTISPLDDTPWREHHSPISRTIRSGALGSRIAAVPTPTRDAPPRMYAIAPAPVAPPPTPRMGSFTARRTLCVANTPTGRIARPLTPPVPKPSAGFRCSTSITNPGIVFTTLIASAPA